MASQTSIVAKQVRLMEYTGLSDPSKGNGRGGLVRQAWHYKSKLLLPSQTCSESMPGPGCSTAAPVACIRNAGGLSAEIFPDISPEMPRCLVEAFGHAE